MQLLIFTPHVPMFTPRVCMSVHRSSQKKNYGQVLSFELRSKILLRRPEFYARGGFMKYSMSFSGVSNGHNQL